MRLTVKDGQADDRQVEITDGMTIGREPGCDLVLDDPRASRRHAHLTVTDGGGVFLKDLDSSNGTFVDGQRISGLVALHGGERITVGRTEMLVGGDGGEPARAGQATRAGGGTMVAPVPGPVAVREAAGPASPEPSAGRLPSPPAVPPLDRAAPTSGPGGPAGGRSLSSWIRSHRRLLIVLLAVLVVLSAINIGARVWAQHVASRQTARALEMSKEPDVTLKGFPFLVRAALGNLSEVTIQASDVTVKGVPLQRFRISLHGVTYSARQLLSDKPGKIHARAGEGTVAMSGDALTALLKQHGIPIDVGLLQSKLHINGGSIPGFGSILGQPQANLSVRGRELTLAPIGIPIPTSFSLSLPNFIPGVRYVSVRVEGSVMVLEFRLADVDLNVPKPPK